MPLKIIFCFLLNVSFIKSQNLDNSTAKIFLNSLIANDKTLSSFVSPDELSISNRLEISYDKVINKFLISYEMDSAIVSGIKSGKLKYVYNIKELRDGYSLLQFSVSQEKYHKEYYFKYGKLVSPPSYFSSNWKNFESGYFKFFISDSSLFNTYCAEALNEFVDRTARKLNYTESDLKLLKEKKIYYYLCRNDEEIKQLTGYSALGMYNLAYDYIITIYTCHYHELVHLLMNFKLKNIPLFTSPFLQEGIAVALGGRGGKAPGVILDMGAFLVNSDMLDYTAMLEKQQFQQMDASMAYAVSGLYNLFLIQNIGDENYLKLYRKYSGSAAEDMSISENDLPPKDEWRKFAFVYESPSYISPDPIFDKNKQLIFAAKYKIYDGGDEWIFEVKDTALINISETTENYESRIINEIIPNIYYNGGRYLITANESEISLYDIFTNELIGKYVSSFTEEMKPWTKNERGYYLFSISKEIFPKSKNFIFK